MTRFWRNGFYRTNIHGNTHWVDGHWVDRDEWNHGGRNDDYYVYHRTFLEETGANRSYTAQFISPNAVCPICGARVFFYRNDLGSKVYFDELGWPWPKHPCLVSYSDSVQTSSPWPTIRNEREIERINGSCEVVRTNTAFAFELRFGRKPPIHGIVAARLKAGKGSVLIVRTYQTKGQRDIFLFGLKLPRSLKKGRAIYIDGDQISHFDVEKSAPQFNKIRKIKGVQSLVDTIIV